MKLTIILLLLILSSYLYPINLNNLKTGSMPCFQEDSYLEIQEVSFFSLKLNDVICYRPSEVKLNQIKQYVEISPLAQFAFNIFQGNNNYVCHRIVYKDATSVIVKSDISFIPDIFRIEPNDYRGKIANRNCY